MKMIAGYEKEDDEMLIDTQNDITVNSCGRYELVHQKDFSTFRPKGRSDYQLLYIARGKAYFTFNSKEEVLNEGHFIIYFPEEPQFYHYHISDNPIVYWIHFSGLHAKNILANYFSLSKSSRIFNVGVKSELISLIDKMIAELNIKRDNYQDLCRLYIKQLVLLSSRNLQDKYNKKSKNYIIEEAIQYFNDNSHETINIEEYALSHNVSCSWFIRTFKKYTGTTPTHYINFVRINKAKSLLATGTLSIKQISNIVGYQNPLYFSRIFKKYVGTSPKNYLSEL